MRTSAGPGRHRLGSPGLTHCVAHLEVALALDEHRRGWWHALTTPARHSLAGLRRRAIAELRVWTPATA